MPKDTHVLPKDHTQSCPLLSTHMALKKKKKKKKKPAFSTFGPVSLVGCDQGRVSDESQT